MSLRLYLSASLFTAAEQAFNRHLAAGRRAAGCTVFSPQEIDRTQDQKTTFNLNVNELKSLRCRPGYRLYNGRKVWLMS